jgi:hypothetical protein
MRVSLLAGLLLLTGCGEPGPALNAAQRQLRLDREIARVRHSMDPCVIDEGDAISSRRYRDCLDLLPQERMRGIWYSGFEESGFVRGATSAPAVRVIGRDSRNPEFETFLELDEDAVWRRLGIPQDHMETHAIALDFLGRRSRHAGAYYASEHGHVVVLDRLISARLLGPVESLIDCRAWPRVPESIRCAPGTRSDAEPAQPVR